jgi:glycosyltransferase involved in cell wall biosynthesis
MKEIALVTYALQVGGVETFIKLLADYFQSQGHKVDLIETLTRGRWSETFEAEGYRVVRVLPDSFHSHIHHARRVSQILRNYDAIILNDAPYAQAVLGLLPERAVAIPVLHMFLTSMVRNAASNSNNWDALSAVSPAVRDSVVQYGVDGRRVFCIPNGIKVSEQWPKKEYDFLQGNTLHIVYVGAINHTQKGVLYLPGILREALTRGAKIHFEVIGKGADMEELRKSFGRDCPQAVITLHGSLPNHEAMKILSQSDVLIMPSHFEGLPLVLLEAMARGVVPVVSRLTGCTDFVVEDGTNGYFVEPGDKKGFGEVFSRLYKDRQTLKSLSFSAWETIYKRFSYVKTGASYLELIENCTLRRQRGEMLKRTGFIDKTLLGDLPRLPIFLVRPVRKALRMLGLFPQPVQESLLFDPYH